MISFQLVRHFASFIYCYRASRKMGDKHNSRTSREEERNKSIDAPILKSSRSITPLESTLKDIPDQAPVIEDKKGANLIREI